MTRGAWWRLRHRRVPVAAFDQGLGRWRDTTTRYDHGAPRGAVTLATFNLWFDDRHAAARHRAIAGVLAREAPEIMVFQEVTPPALEVLLEQEWIRQRYVRAVQTGWRTGNYGLLVLSSLPLRHARYVPLPTRASRGALLVEAGVGGAPLTVGAVHLDSGKRSARLRARQLDELRDRVAGASEVALLGDFNMRDAENSNIATSFVDVWPQLRPGEPGYTEDTSINLMRLDSTGKQRHVRFDRVLIKGHGWTPTRIELLGTQPISADLPRIFPSDHFGVVCRLERTGTTQHPID